ncbi:MAG TPA: leucine--tRNA ligase, partial [Candidatus Krumholzibacteriaceae bacterium]|nr:leucine--tRNA ligase [Candidatus Krumholzibacteriaceae bacterium]
LKQFNISPESVKAIKPISIIKIEDYGEFPAVEIAQQLGAKDQHDPKADEATKLLYKKEFHSGVLKANCGEYAGKLVRNAKDQLIQDLKRKGIADTMYDLPQPVICRCMTPCIVKILEDQWFLTYNDPEWKEKTKQALAQAKVYPETAVPWFLAIIDWLKEWACARKTGFGTPLKWSPGWIIETLSDSTVYMAFYTINKHIRQNDIKPEQLTPEVFDYIFYGKGKANAIAEKTRIKPEILQSMHEEFLYWYPVDLRNSAKELVPNHLTFFLFHHVALFPPEHWPCAIGVNGMLMIEGEKMSKSKGNFITLHKAIEQYGADATRCALLLGAEGMDDPDWRSENIKDLDAKLESFYRLAESVTESAKAAEIGHLEKWLLSVLQNRIRAVTESLEQMKTRTAIETALYETWNDFRWYTRRKGDTNATALKEAFNIWTRLMAPFAPHLCEEIWNKMGEKQFISTSPWPKYDEAKVDVDAEEGENLIRNVIDDTQNILNATKIAPKKICYYTAAEWKWKVYRKVLDVSARKIVVMAELMKELMQDKELKANAKQVAKFVPQVIEEVNRMPNDKKQRQLQIGKVDEEKTLREAMVFFEREFNAEIQVYTETDPKRYDPKKRAELARPYRPAIFIE